MNALLFNNEKALHNLKMCRTTSTMNEWAAYWILLQNKKRQISLVDDKYDGKTIILCLSFILFYILLNGLESVFSGYFLSLYLSFHYVLLLFSVFCFFFWLGWMETRGPELCKKRCMQTAWKWIIRVETTTFIKQWQTFTIVIIIYE